MKNSAAIPVPIGTQQLRLSLEPERHIYQVSELNAAVQSLFESRFRAILIAGEISGCRLATSGHYYFCLKDSQSQLKCALFKNAARTLRFKPQDGLSVLARGSLEVYEARGEYQLIVESLEPQGTGALQIAFEQLKKRLAEEGLFEQARKKALPALPRRIAVVTSPAGAVIRDILHVLERRFPGLHIRLFPALVQGDGAVEQVCRGIHHFGSDGWADVIIIARGGGSLEDLWAFNEEAVARAIAACPVPVISAIGHETDFTIADFVADCRAPTPSAAAEIVICTKESLFDQIGSCRRRGLQAVRYCLLTCSRNLHQRGTGRAATILGRVIAKRMQRLDELDYQLRNLKQRLLEAHGRRLSQLSHRLRGTDLRLRLARHRHRHDQLEATLTQSIYARLSERQQQLATADAHLKQLSPLTVLARGYAIVENSQGAILRSASETAEGGQLHVRLRNGQLDAIVSAVHPDGHSSPSASG
jgi:exodeoxyribonuclease VII large subunit